MPTRLPKQYLFIDESGKPEVYSGGGVNLVEAGFATKFLVLVAVRTPDQLELQQQVTEFRLQLLKDKSLVKLFSTNYSLDAFHAQPDYPEVKERFYAFITGLDIRLDVLVVEKLQCYPSIKSDPSRLYGVMAGQLLKNLCHHATDTEIIFSRRDSKLKVRDKLETEVERARLDFLEKHPRLSPSISLSYHHNPHYTHGGLQIADYVAHAVFRLYEQGNRQYYDLVKSKIGKIQDICNRKFYTKNNPL